MPCSSLFHTWIERDGANIPVSVLYEAYGPVRGARGSCGEPLEPDEGAEVVVLNTCPRDLTDAELARIEWEIREEEGLE